MKFTVVVELEHLSGPEQDEDTMIDYFCGTIGQQNGARTPLKLTTGEAEYGEPVSVYQVRLADTPR